MLFDPMSLLFLAPGLLLAMWAQARVSTVYAQASRIAASSGLSGAEAAAELLRAEGVGGVAIEPVAGLLSDHYDPTTRILRLSQEVYAGRSLAALGVAAHEAGHALQDASRYAPLVVRNLIVPAAGFGSNAAWLVLIAGAVLGVMQLVVVGLALFSTTVLLQLVNLPVELDASRRARQALALRGLISPEEEPTVAQVLNAAAWTYVASTLTSILTLLYYLSRFGLFGGRRRDD